MGDKQGVNPRADGAEQEHRVQSSLKKVCWVEEDEASEQIDHGVLSAEAELDGGLCPLLEVEGARRRQLPSDGRERGSKEHLADEVNPFRSLITHGEEGHGDIHKGDLAW